MAELWNDVKGNEIDIPVNTAERLTWEDAKTGLKEADWKRQEAERITNYMFDNMDDPEQAEATIGLVDYFSKIYSVPKAEVVKDIPGFIKRNAGDVKPEKTFFRQVWDSTKDGWYTDTLGTLGSALKDTDDPDMRKYIQQEIDEVRSKMSNPEGNKPREGFVGYATNAVASAGNLVGNMVKPFMFNLAVTSLIPAAKLPAFATRFGTKIPQIVAKGAEHAVSLGATWSQTWRVEAGNLYLDLIDAGVDPIIAKKESDAHGAVAGFLEAAPLEVAFTKFPFLKPSAFKAAMRMSARTRVKAGILKAFGDVMKEVAIPMATQTAAEVGTEILQEVSSIKHEEKARTTPASAIKDEKLRQMFEEDYAVWAEEYDKIVQENKDYFASKEYAEYVKDRIWETGINVLLGVGVLSSLGGAVNAANMVRSSRENAKAQVQRDNRKAELEKEKEVLKDVLDKIYNQDREKAIDGELADIAEQEKQETVDEAVEAEQESREQFVNNQTPENRENYDNARAQRDAVETEANKSPTQEAYDEKINKQGFDETDVDDLIRYNDMLETEENRESAGNWQLPPEEIRRTAVQPEPDDEIRRVAGIIREKTPDVSDVEAEIVAGTFIDMLSQGLNLSHDETVQTVFMPGIAMNVKAGEPVNIGGHEVTVPKTKKGAVFFNPDDGKAMILLTGKSDFSTWLHEGTHILRRYVTGDALNTLEKHYKVKNGKWTVKAEERFAEDVTTFLMTGEAPVAELESVFQMIAKALLNIYYTLVGRDMVSDDIRQVFEQMFADPKSVFGQKQAGRETLYQVFGRQGAQTLDWAQGVTYRMDNYEVALEMDKAGKSAKSIRFATGWEKGADGEWRYEEKDIRIKDTIWDKQLKERAEQLAPQYLRNEELLKIPAYMRTEEQTQELRAVSKVLRDERKVSEKLWKEREKELSKYKDKEIALEELVDAPELFSAYPPLREMKLHFRSEEEMEGNDGWYDKANDEVAVNNYFLILPQNKLRRTLAHEIQHVIQDIEGFAPGGSSAVFNVENLDVLSKRIAELPKKNPNRKRLNDILKVLKKNVDEGYVDLTAYGIPDIVTPYEAYRMIAGEVEAWNVEKRLEMTPAERMLTLLSETGDYPLDQQIILGEYEQSARIEDPAEAEKQYNEVVAKYKGTDQWLKAHNGQPTKLTERQWVQVRTPNFKKWFGDWENDPQNASKVVDENGEPKVVYHGTLSARRFTKFNPKKGYNVNAIWHASNIDVSAHWSNTRQVTRFDETLAEKVREQKNWDSLAKFVEEELGIKGLKHSVNKITPKEAKEFGVKAGTYYGWSTELSSYGHIPVKSEAELFDYVKEQIIKHTVEDATRDVASQIFETQTFTYADFINLRNPLVADAQGKSYHDIVYNGEKVNEESLASIAQEQGNDGVIVNNVLETDYENIKTDDFITFSPEQIKSATDNVGTFSQSNPSILYQEEEDTYRDATEKGEFIPDNILNEYKGKDWADAEIEARVDYRKEAITYKLNGSTAEQFLYDMSVNGEGKGEDYLQEIWSSTPEVKPDQIITSLTRRMLERIISTLKSISEKEKKEMGWPWNDLIKNYSETHMISEDSYKSLMAQMKAEPQQYIEFLSECFDSQQEFVDMLYSLYLHPDMEIERIKELERAIRGDQQTAKTTIAGLKDRIAELKTELREAILKGTKYQKLATRFAKLRALQKRRDTYNKLVRAIFRKIPQMCAIDVAEEIEAIREKYSPVKMKDTTRAKLEQEYLNTDNQNVKDKIQKRLNQKSLRDMTLEEVAEIAVLVTELCREGVDKRLDQLLAIREQRLVEATDLKTDVATSKDPHIVGSLSGKENKGNIYNRFVSYWADIHRMVDWMGPHWKASLDKIKDTYVEEMKNEDRRMTALDNKMAELKLNAKVLSKVEKLGNDTFTHNDLIGIYIALQNEDSRDALIFGNFRANPDTVDGVIDTIFEGLSYLTDAEKEFADWMVDSFSGTDRDRLWSAYRKNENKSPPIIPRYFPMKRLLEGSARIDDEPLIDIGQRSSRMVAVSKGFMKERLHNINWQHQAPIRIDALNIYTQAIQDQEHYIAFGQLSKDMKYVWAKVREDVTTKFGNSWAKSMGEWIDTVIDPRAYNRYYDNNNFFTNVLSNSIVASLTYNILTYLKQFPSVMFFLPYCSGSTLSLTTFKFMRDFKQMTEFAFKRSPWLKNRNIDDIQARTKKRLANPNAKFRTATKVSELGMEPISWIDEFACVIGWNAVYAHEMEHGATEDAAIRKADEALLRTQPQAFSMFSPKGYRNPMLRTFLMFTRQANQITQMLTSDIPNIFRSDKEAKEKAKTFMRTAFCIALNAVVMGWAARHFHDYDDDDNPVADTFANLIKNFPIIGTAIANAMQRKQYSTGGFVDPISSFITAAGKFLDDAIKQKEIDYDKLMKMISEGMGPAGLPKVFTWRAWRALRESDWWYLFTGGPKEDK